MQIKKISFYNLSIANEQTISFSVSIYEMDENIVQLIKRADYALYKAKRWKKHKVI